MHYYKKKVILTSEFIKKRTPFGQALKKLFCQFAQINLEFVLHDWCGFFYWETIGLFDQSFNYWIVDHLISQISTQFFF